MKDLDAVKEGLSNTLYENEPLAMAIISYLDKSNPKAHKEIIDIFDRIIEAKFNLYIQDYKNDDITQTLLQVNYQYTLLLYVCR